MMALWYHFGLVQIIIATGIVQAETNFSFLSFPTAKRFLVLNDTKHSPGNSSFLLNAQAATMEPSCGRLLYNETVRMKNATSGALASFHTAFTFRIYGPNKEYVAAPVYYHGDGLAFTFARNATLMDGVGSGSALCLPSPLVDAFFAVEFDTYLTSWYGDSSDSHVGINLNSMNSTWSYNLCEDKQYCSYLCNGGYFTAWIDYYSSSQILQVFFARGSLLDNVSKPPQPLIGADLSEVSAQIAKLVDEFMYVGFSSGTGVHREVHQIASWTFTSSMTQFTTVPVSLLIPPQMPPVGSPSSLQPPVSVSIPEEPPLRSRAVNQNIIIGASVAGGIILIVGSSFCYLKVLRGPLITDPISGLKELELYPFGGSLGTSSSSSSNQGFHPLRIFISHTGGPTGSEKNFAIRLFEALKANAEKLKSNYDVFIDRIEMKKGVPFPDAIMQKIKITDLGIVVVTDEFFKKRWPMIELVQLMELQKQSKPGREVLVLPLFYKLTVTELKSGLESGSWEGYWTEMSTAKHPVDLGEFKAAVNFLCSQNGVEYNFRNASHDTEYIQQILSEVDKIYKERTPHVQESMELKMYN